MRIREPIVPIILAAGSSLGLPFPKALAPFDGQTAMQIAVENCLVLGRPLAVLGLQAKRILPKVPKNSQAVINRRWREGQLSSLQRARKPIPIEAALLLYPVDHPLLKRSTMAHLLHAFLVRTAAEENDITA